MFLDLNAKGGVNLINYYKLLDKISPAKAKLLNHYLKVSTFNRAFGQDSIQLIPYFLSIYSKIIADRKEDLSKKVLQISTSKLMNNDKITIEEHFIVLKALNTMVSVIF